MALSADAEYMQRALALATKGRGLTWPNPMVGAVLVKSGKIIAEGYHQKAGKDHAEIVALKKGKVQATRGDSVCHAGTVLSYRQDRTLC